MISKIENMNYICYYMYSEVTVSLKISTSFLFKL